MGFPQLSQKHKKGPVVDSRREAKSLVWEPSLEDPAQRTQGGSGIHSAIL